MINTANQLSISRAQRHHTRQPARKASVKPSQHNIRGVLEPLQAAHHALRCGVATQRHWAVMAGCIQVAQAIEAQGTIHGLTEHLASAHAAMQAIFTRCSGLGTWRNTALRFDEADALRTFVDLHTLQIQQLGQSGYLRAINDACATRTTA